MTATLTFDTLDSFKSQIKKFPVLSYEEETFLAKQYFDNNNLDAAKKLVESNLRFVVKIAYEFKNYPFDILELIQEGCVGLMVAVRKFNPYKGFKLTTYAVDWIKCYIRDFIERNWSMIKIKTTTKNRSLFYKTEIKDDNEISEDIKEMIYRKKPLISLSNPAWFNSDDTLQDKIASDIPIQDESYEIEESKRILNSRIANVLSTFNERDRKLIDMRIMSDEPKTLKEIANIFGISKEYVRQMEMRIMKKLKTELEDCKELV